MLFAQDPAWVVIQVPMLLEYLVLQTVYHNLHVQLDCLGGVSLSCVMAGLESQSY
jgi:hypothetical protein